MVPFVYRFALALLCIFVFWRAAAAQSVQKPETDITPEGEMATFEMADGFEVMDVSFNTLA